MPSQPSSDLLEIGTMSRRLGAVAAVLVVIIACLDLVGWAFGIDGLIQPISTSIPSFMMPNTAAGFLWVGAGLLLMRREDGPNLRRRAGQLFAGLVSLLGILTLGEYLLEVDLRIDHLLFFEAVQARTERFPGRPAPNTAICFLLSGVSLLLMAPRRRRGRSASGTLALIVAFVALQALLGHVYGEERHWAPDHVATAIEAFTPMALPTGLAFLLAACGVIFARPDRWPAAALFRPDLGGIVLRRLLPVVVCVPFLMGWLRLWGERKGLYHTTFGLALFVMATTAALTLLLGWSADALRRLDETRREAESALRRSEMRLSGVISTAAEGIIFMDMEGRITQFNASAERIFGYDAAEVIGRSYEILIPPHLRERHRQQMASFAEGLQSARLMGNRSPVIGLRKNGEEFPLEASIAKLEVEDERLLAIVLRDITERHRAEEALKRSEQGLALAQEMAHLGNLDLDLRTNYRTWSDETYRILGYAPGEVEPSVEAFTDRLPPEDRPLVVQQRQRAMRSGRTEHQEYRIRHPDGTQHIVATATRVYVDDQRRPIRIVGTLQDISEQKRLEAALREARQRLELALTAADIGTYLFHIGAGTIDVDARLARLFGLPARVAAGLPIGALLEVVHPDDLPALKARIRETIEHGGDFEMEYRLLRRDGSIRWLEGRGRCERDDHGQAVEMPGVVADITDRKRVEQHQRLLAETGALLSSTLDPGATLASVARLSLPLLADWCEIDLRTRDDHAEVMELAASDAGRQHQLEGLATVCPAAVNRYGNTVGRAMLTGEPVFIPEVTDAMLVAWARDEGHLARLRTLAPRSFMVVPLLARGRSLGVMVLASCEAGRRYDARDLELARELAYRAALAVDNAYLFREAEHASRVRDEVLRVVAHDLRSPLTGISLTVQLLKRRAGEPEQRMLEAILKAIGRANRLISDLLDVARMEAGKLSIERRIEEVAPLLSESLEEHQDLAEARALHLEWEIPDDLPPIRVDRDRVLQILSNLLGNAIKFTPEGGRISLSAAREGELVRISVSDTGPGIPTADLPRLFEPFWQVRKGGRDGAGLGLAIVKGLVEAHGGRIGVESTPGIGSTFTFTLPVASLDEVSTGERQLRPPAA